MRVGIAIILRPDALAPRSLTQAAMNATYCETKPSRRRGRPTRGERVGAGWHVLVSQRPAGVARAGWWEFPGGKIEPGESGLACVVRECAEEVGLRVRPVAELAHVVHSYAHATVSLEPWVCLVAGAADAHQRGPDDAPVGQPQSDDDPRAEPQAIEVAAVQWVALDDLPVDGFLEANGPIIEAARAWAADAAPDAE
jgi:mutator protein MutT